MLPQIKEAPEEQYFTLSSELNMHAHTCAYAPAHIWYLHTYKFAHKPQKWPVPNKSLLGIYCCILKIRLCLT